MKPLFATLTIASAFLLVGCTEDTSPSADKKAEEIKKVAKSLPAEEKEVYRFAGLLLNGNYKGLFQQLSKLYPEEKLTEDFVTGMYKMNFGYIPERVAQCGGLADYTLDKREEIKPGKEYRFTYLVTLKNADDPKCKGGKLPPIISRLKNNGVWDIILPM